MNESAAYQFQSSSSTTDRRLDRVQTDVSDLRTQLIRTQSDLEILRMQSTSKFVPWTTFLRVLDVCAIGMGILVLLVLAHGFKMI